MRLHRTIQTSKRLSAHTDQADRAVSPVVGVVLMVALTVVLAGVVGVFAFGIGDVLQPAQPTTMLDIEGDVSDAEPHTLNATIEHSAGDRLDADELTVALRDRGSTIETATVDELGEAYDGTDEWRIGETITVEEYELETGDIDASSELTLAIVHEPSQSTIATGEIDH